MPLFAQMALGLRRHLLSSAAALVAVLAGGANGIRSTAELPVGPLGLSASPSLLLQEGAASTPRQFSLRSTRGASADADALGDFGPHDLEEPPVPVQSPLLIRPPSARSAALAPVSGIGQSASESVCSQTDRVDRWWRRRPSAAADGRIDSSADVIEDWKQGNPGAPIFYDDGHRSCVLHQGDTSLDSGSERCGPGADRLTLVSQAPAPACNFSSFEYTAVVPERFQVLGSMREKAEERHYAVVWPNETRCASHCPMVVDLHGAGGHGYPSRGAWIFQKVARIGLLRLFQRDRSCAADLGSVLLFPQLLPEERWEWSGHVVFSEFVIPLIDHVKALKANFVDEERVALIGFSEGSVGALHGALRYPDVFSLVVSTSFTWPEWWQAPDTSASLLEGLRAPSRPVRLKRFVVALSETQPTQYFGHNGRALSLIKGLFRQCELADRVELHARLYAGFDHFSNLDAVTNRWPSFHRVLWRGDWSELDCTEQEQERAPGSMTMLFGKNVNVNAAADALAGLRAWRKAQEGTSNTTVVAPPGNTVGSAAAPKDSKAIAPLRAPPSHTPRALGRALRADAGANAPHLDEALRMALEDLHDGADDLMQLS